MEVVGFYPNITQTAQELRGLRDLLSAAGRTARGHRQTRATRQVQRRLTGSELKQLEIDYLAGTPIKNLADKYSIGRATVHTHANRLGLPHRYQTMPRRGV